MLLLLGFAALYGCTAARAPEPACDMCRVTSPAAAQPAHLAGRSAPANLALGPSPAHNALAQALTMRSGWPSVETGYTFDDITYFVQDRYDRQSYYDRLGGGFWHETESVRAGVFLR